MKKMVYAPSCALLCYKPHLAEKLGKVIAEIYGDVELQQVCCFDRPVLDEETHIITPCTTCVRQYEQNYPLCTTELLFGEPTMMSDADIEPWNGKLLSFRRVQKTK